MRPTGLVDQAVAERVNANVDEDAIEVINTDMDIDPDVVSLNDLALPDLCYRPLGVRVQVHCPVASLRQLLKTHWDGLESCQQAANRAARGRLNYRVSKRAAASSIAIHRDGRPTIETEKEGEFLFELETDVIISLQLLRSDLYFLHAAVAERDGKVILLVARSGGGKSTTLWGLLHHGWKYFSDELAPIDLDSMSVFPYRRALTLKRLPPSGFPLPDTALTTNRTIHIPVCHLPRVSDRSARRISAVYFVQYSPETGVPQVNPLSSGEAGARLYANALNPLAHTNAGLEAACQIARSVPCYSLTSADLAKTCVLLGQHARRDDE